MNTEKTKEFAVFFLLLVLLIYGAYKIFGYIDVQLADDTHYLQLGMQLPFSIKMGYGPLYALYYRIIHLFTHDKWTTYFVAYSLLCVLPVIFMYWFLKTNKVNALFSFIISLSFFISPFNLFFDNWSKIGHFALCFLFLTLILYKKHNNIYKKTHILIFFSFLMGYIRPEYHLAFLAFLGIYFIYIFYKKQYKMLALQGGLVILLSPIYYKFLSPLRGGRSIIAFAQQFIANISAQQNIPITDNIKYLEKLKTYFGTANSVSEAMQANPKAFANHLFYNSGLFFTKIYCHLCSWITLNPLDPQPATISIIGTALLLFVLFVFLKKSKKTNFSYITWNNVIPVILFIPTIIVCWVMRPNPHYLILFVPLLLAPLIIVLRNIKAAHKWQLILTVILAVIFIKFWNINTYAQGSPWGKRASTCQQTPNKSAFLLLKNHPDTQKNLVFLDVEGGLNFYISKKWTWANPFNDLRQLDFKRFVEKNKVDIIYITPAMCAIKEFREDSNFQMFLSDPAPYGFKKTQLFPSAKCEIDSIYAICTRTEK